MKFWEFLGGWLCERYPAESIAVTPPASRVDEDGYHVEYGHCSDQVRTELALLLPAMFAAWSRARINTGSQEREGR